MVQAALQKVPVIRILLPFLLGIISSYYSSGTLVIPLVLLALAIICFGFLTFCARRSVEVSLKLRHFYIVPISVIAISLGMVAEIIGRPLEMPLPDVNGHAIVGRVEQTRFNGTSQSIYLTLLRSNSTVTVAGVKAFVTTRGCDYRINAGDVIAFNAKFRPIRGNGNPFDFDYARYMRGLGFIYTQHIPVSSVVICGHDRTWRTWVENKREHLRHAIFNSSLSPDAQNFVVALVMGDRYYLDSDTMHQFSMAGIAHLLALSGLHIGIISFLLWFVLLPLEYMRLRWLRYILTFAVLISFDVFTGLSPSVVRATVLIGFLFLAFALRRRYAPVNALLWAAFFILIFSPDALFSAGFQLSFVTVSSILVFSPQIRVKSRLVNYLITLVATSFIAMASTLMLTAYYFHSVPLLSFMTNVLVIPVFPLILILAVVYVALLAFGLDSTVISWGLDGLHHMLLGIADGASTASFMNVSGVSVSLTVLLLYYLLLLLFAWWIYSRSRLSLVSVVVCTFVMFLSWHWHYTSAPRHGLIVLNSYNSTPIFSFHNGNGTLWVPDAEDVSTDDFRKRHTGLMARLRIDSIMVAPTDSLFNINSTTEFIHHDFAYLNGKRIVSIGLKSRLKKYGSQTDLRVDFAIISKRFHGDIPSLLRQFHPSTIILSGDIHDDDLERLVAQCDSCGVAYHAIAIDGAYSEL